jgi:UDP-N-acetylglucosamine/UDP-N-acetylgalactosamine diphosphorylase
MLFFDLPPMALVDHKPTHLEQTHMQNQTVEVVDSDYKNKLKALSEYHKSYSEKQIKPSNIAPLDDVFFSGNEDLMDIGKELIQKGKVACLIVAGGQGTRLGFPHAKGMYPTSVVKKKSLFQILAEKVKACGDSLGQELQLAVMTSPLNDQEIKAFFLKNSNFGLKKNQLHFFSQEMLPFLDEQGNAFYESPGVLAQGPDGNGASLEHLIKADFYKGWKKKGIEHLVFIQIDNPLADPFDFELLGFHHKHHNQVSIKGTLRSDPEEKVGLVVKGGNKVKVVEYSELSDEQKNMMNEKGELLFQSANLSMFCFSLPFVEKALQESHAFPMHQAYKKAEKWNDQSKEKEAIMAYKYEKFIFDILDRASEKEVKVILYPREFCFSPLKNADGKDSLKSVQKSMVKRDKDIFYQITGRVVSYKEFELSQEFYYPTEDLIKYYQNLEKLDSNYLERSL